jgi:hypothetical protein
VFDCVNLPLDPRISCRRKKDRERNRSEVWPWTNSGSGGKPVISHPYSLRVSTDHGCIAVPVVGRSLSLRQIVPSDRISSLSSKPGSIRPNCSNFQQGHANLQNARGSYRVQRKSYSGRRSHLGRTGIWWGQLIQPIFQRSAA